MAETTLYRGGVIYLLYLLAGGPMIVWPAPSPFDQLPYWVYLLPYKAVPFILMGIGWQKAKGGE